MDEDEETPDEGTPIATGGDPIEDDTLTSAVTSAAADTVTDTAGVFGLTVAEGVADVAEFFGADETAAELRETAASTANSLDSMGEPPPSEEDQAGADNVIEDLEEREQARSFQEQCYLLYNWTKFAGFNRDVTYRRFMKIQDGGNSPSEMLNAMTAAPSLAQAIEELPAVYSSLVPKIRLYKSYIPTDDINAEAVDVEVRFDNFTSDVHELMTTEAAHRGQGAGIKSFEFKNTGNMPGAAVRSLEATLSLHLNSLSDIEVVRAHPRDSATADDAALALLEDTEPVRIIDLFTPSSALGKNNTGYNRHHYRIKAVVGWETPAKAITGQAELETLRDFTARTSHTFFLELINHELDLKEDGTVGISISYIATLENALRSAQPGDSDVLFGTLPQAQQLLITAERLSIEAQREAMQERVSQRGCDAQDRSRLSGRNEEAQAEAGREARDEASAGNEAREEALQATENRQRMTLYQNFLETLVESHGLRYIDVEGEELGVVSRRLSMSDWGSVALRSYANAQRNPLGVASIPEAAEADLEGRTQGQLTGTEAARRRAARGIDIDIASRIRTVRYNLEHTGRAGNLTVWEGRGNMSTTTTISGDNNDPSVNSQALSGIRAATDTLEDSRIVEGTAGDVVGATNSADRFAARGRNTEAWRSLTGANRGTTEALAASLVQATDTARVEPGKYRVFFIYLGDLIDTALSFVESPSTRKELRQMRTLVGPTEFIDPSTPDLLRNYVNLADVPISWNELQKWFGREIVATNVLQISFSEFLTKVTESLLRSALGPRCFERNMDGVVATSAVVTSNMFQLASMIDPFIQAIPDYPYGGTVVDFNPALFSQDSIAYAGDESSSYLFIFGQMRDPTSLIFDPATDSGTRRSRDATKGIYHLRHGAATGIVKRITFKRKDDPQLRSANIARAAQSSSGADRFRVLRERYDADVSMLGNGLFKPGDYVYIDPTFWTHNSTPGSIIGTNTTFKGYYSVLESRSAIESGKYETEISCVYQADGETSEDYSGTRPGATSATACENTSPQSLGGTTTTPAPPSVSSAAGSPDAQ